MTLAPEQNRDLAPLEDEGPGEYQVGGWPDGTAGNSQTDDDDFSTFRL